MQPVGRALAKSGSGCEGTYGVGYIILIVVRNACDCKALINTPPFCCGSYLFEETLQIVVFCCWDLALWVGLLTTVSELVCKLATIDRSFGNAGQG